MNFSIVNKQNLKKAENKKAKFSNYLPGVKSQDEESFRKNFEDSLPLGRENASSISSSTSFKNLNMQGINNTITETLRPAQYSGGISNSLESKSIYSSKYLNLKHSSDTPSHHEQIQKSSKIMKKKSASFKYFSRVRRGLNTIERLKLWKSLPKRQEYMEYYRNKRHCNIKRSEYYLEIKNDVKRTYIHNSLSEETEAHHSLINILAIYAMRNTDIGYIQGLNFLAGTLLLQ